MRTLLSIILLSIINASANAEPYPWDLVKDARFNHAYKAALGPKAKEPWLAKLDGPSNEAKKVRVGGRDYLSNPRLRTLGVSPGVKASEGWEGFDLSFAFQVPRA